MNESAVSSLDTRPEFYIGNVSGYELKRFYEWSQIDLWWVVLVSYKGYGSAFWNVQVEKFVAIPNRTYVSAIRMKQVH